MQQGCFELALLHHSLLFAPSWRTVVRIAHDNHVAGGASLPPLVDPLIINMMKVDVRQERADHSPNAKGNFCFDRVIPLDRSQVVLDLRLKGNIYMPHVAIDRSAEGGTAQCGPWVARGWSERGGGCRVVVAPVAMSRRQAIVHRGGPDDRPPGRGCRAGGAVTFSSRRVWSTPSGRAAAEGTTISDMVSRALRAFSAKPAAMAERRSYDRSVQFSTPSTVSSPSSSSRSTRSWSRNRSAPSAPIRA